MMLLFHLRSEQVRLERGVEGTSAFRACTLCVCTVIANCKHDVGVILWILLGDNNADNTEKEEWEPIEFDGMPHPVALPHAADVKK
jgi:hypothetical protein